MNKRFTGFMILTCVHLINRHIADQVVCIGLIVCVYVFILRFLLFIIFFYSVVHFATHFERCATNKVCSIVSIEQFMESVPRKSILTGVTHQDTDYGWTGVFWGQQ